MKRRQNTAVMPILAALFAALISVGAYIAFPVPGSPVPVVLQNMFIMLTGLLLGPVWGALSVLLYLFLGLIGLPVFSGGAKGLAALMGPTGGYLISYIPAVLLIGLLCSGKASLYRCFFALSLSAAVTYLFGVPWLAARIDIPLMRAVQIGFFPFILGDCIKIVAASLIGWKLKPVLRDLLS